MQVSVEESGAIERRLTVSVPAEKIESEITRRLKDVARRARIPGFRPGKAPQSIIRKRYSPQVTSEVVTETINSSYIDALGQAKIVPAGLVSIEPARYESGKDLEYVAVVELFPEIPAATLDGVTIEKPIVEVTEADVDRTLEDIRKSNPRYTARDGKSEKGDKLLIDFTGAVDGKSFRGGTAQDFPLVLGRGQMHEQFDGGLLGAGEGETRQIAFTFAADHHLDEVAGKRAEFAVTVKRVEKPELPNLDGEFARMLGIREGGIEKMREEVEKNLNRELAARLRSDIRNKVMDALFDKNQFDVPKALLEDEIDRSVKVISDQFAAQGLPTDKIDRGRYREEANKRVSLALIAKEIVEKNRLEIDHADVKARIVEMASEYEDSDAYVNYHTSSPERLKQVENVMIEEEVIKVMLESAVVKEVKMSFREFMNPDS